jgi:hypothetical protein
MDVVWVFQDISAIRIGLRLKEQQAIRIYLVVQSENSHSFVGAGSLMIMQRYSDQQVPLNSMIHNSLMRPNPPILDQYRHC